MRHNRKRKMTISVNSKELVKKEEEGRGAGVELLYYCNDIWSEPELILSREQQPYIYIYII